MARSVSCGTCPCMVLCMTRARLCMARGSFRSGIQYSFLDLSGPGFLWCGRFRSMVGRIFFMCSSVV
eukprot:6874405-Prorocentrum_lima.AAC.1